MGMGRAEQTGRGTGAASGQEVGGRSAGMPPVVICGWAGGPEGRMGLPKLYPPEVDRAARAPEVRAVPGPPHGDRSFGGRLETAKGTAHGVPTRDGEPARAVPAGPAS